MKRTLLKIIKYLAYIVMSNAVYGLIIYFTYTWIAAYSAPLAYLINLVLIAAGLALDELLIRIYKSKYIVENLRKTKDAEKEFRLIKLQAEYFVSFKSALYLFYVLVLVASKLIDSGMTFFGENVSGFIAANTYGILVLIAFDQLIGQFAKDRKKMSEALEKLRRDLFGT
ncbi:MAG: hypothetical protein FWF03_06275 [Defluviitaleaceae bacterium]|nr:hypothetical protein [Defluviitaleaceae bacterium]